MTFSYRVKFAQENRTNPDHLVQLIHTASPCAIVAVHQDDLIVVSSGPLDETEVRTSLEMEAEQCRLVIQGNLSLAHLAELLSFLEGTVVRTDVIPDLYQQHAMGALVLGLSERPGSLVAIETLADSHQWEMNLLDNHPSLYRPGVLLMDMDSTAIQIECIDEIAKLAGVGEQVAEVTELAMQGKLDFSESLRGRVATLAGADAEILEQVRQNIPMTKGLPELVAVLQRSNWKVAIASGGFTYFAEHLKDELSLDAVFANVLEIHEGKLTGKVVGDIVDAHRKAEVMTMLVEKYGVEQGQAVAAGDGANDLVMMEASDMGVAFHAKPIVAAKATTSLHYHGLEGIYYLLASASH